MTTNGNEWELLRGTRFTEAFHVARALSGGLRGGAGRRSNQDRERFPPTFADTQISGIDLNLTRYEQKWSEGVI